LFLGFFFYVLHTSQKLSLGLQRLDLRFPLKFLYWYTFKVHQPLQHIKDVLYILIAT